MGCESVIFCILEDEGDVDLLIFIDNIVYGVLEWNVEVNFFDVVYFIRILDERV